MSLEPTIAVRDFVAELEGHLAAQDVDHLVAKSPDAALVAARRAARYLGEDWTSSVLTTRLTPLTPVASVSARAR